MTKPRITLTPEMLSALTMADQGKPVAGDVVPRRLRGVLMLHGLLVPVGGHRSGYFRTTAKGRKERLAAANAVPAMRPATQ